jgi:hypothetical protein
MSLFQQWLKKRNLIESGLEDKFQFSDKDLENSDDMGATDYADDHDHIRDELFKVVMSKYPTETIEFLNGIAQRGDEEVSLLLSKVQKNTPHNQDIRHPRERDEVKPPTADTGHNPMD